MEILDTPTQLRYNNGNNFPPNFIMIAYAFIIVALVLMIAGAFFVGLALLILALFAITNRHIVLINQDEDFIHDFSQYFGFIKIGKKYPLSKYKYVTTMPLIESQQIYGNHYNSTTVSNSYFTVTVFGDRLKGKRIITKFDSKAAARDIAISLGDRLALKYFDYDPKLVREVLLGQREL